MHRQIPISGAIAIIAIWAALVVGLPLLGVLLADRSVGLLVTFPPLTAPAVHRSFSWLVFVMYLAPSAGVIALIGVAARSRQNGWQSESSEANRRLPWWGWVALGTLLLCWILAWTRFSWFAPYQRLTFIPLWISYIILVNALCVRQSGTCPMVHDCAFFGALFPLSAVFWWFFEYLNQYVHNWLYTGVDYGPLAYSLHATLSFCTVLPAVYTTQKWICNLNGFNSRFYGLPSLRRLPLKLLNRTVLVLSLAGLIGIGVWPEVLFPLLWLAPLVILTALQHHAGQTTSFAAMADGEWRPAVSAAVAALLCGFFWEMWNYYSLAKWTYNIPFVYRFRIFEMPILGYMGYLPFGLLCAEIIKIFQSRRILTDRRKTFGC